MNNIQHLYWRAGFGLSPAEWEAKRDWPIHKAVNELFAQAATARALGIPQSALEEQPMMMSEEDLNAARKKEQENVLYHNGSWVQRMSDPSESALLERMTLFWHGHFACRSRTGKLAIQQLNTLRRHALGDFRSLLLGISKDPSMIRYLNNQQNKKKQPNENFARELMELFTIGRGHYTEQDIKEAARAFTGWSSTSKGDYIFRANWHDTEEKTFFGKKGNFGGEDIIDILLEQRATATFITRKIYRYFVNQKEDQQQIEALSKLFYESGYDISLLMRSIFESSWFYDAQNKGNKIKSPVELMAGMMRAMGITFENNLAPVIVERVLGQLLFNPPNVAGWPGGKSWIDNSTLMIRLNLSQTMLGVTDFGFRPTRQRNQQNERPPRLQNLQAKADLQPVVNLLKQSKDRTEAIKTLSEYLLIQPTSINEELIRRFSPVKDELQFVALAGARLMSLPEYQLC